MSQLQSSRGNRDRSLIPSYAEPRTFHSRRTSRLTSGARCCPMSRTLGWMREGRRLGMKFPLLGTFMSTCRRGRLRRLTRSFTDWKRTSPLFWIKSHDDRATDTTQLGRHGDESQADPTFVCTVEPDHRWPTRDT